MRVFGLTMAMGIWVTLMGPGQATEIQDLSDVELLTETRSAVADKDASQTLRLMQEMQRRGVGLFADREQNDVCKEEIDLPATISDWRFRGAARQAYITAAKARQVEDGTCGCIFDGFPFETFNRSLLGVAPDALTDADRASFESYLQERKSAVDQKFRESDAACRAK